MKIFVAQRYAKKRKEGTISRHCSDQGFATKFIFKFWILKFRIKIEGFHNCYNSYRRPSSSTQGQDLFAYPGTLQNSGDTKEWERLLLFKSFILLTWAVWKKSTFTCDKFWDLVFWKSSCGTWKSLVTFWNTIFFGSFCHFHFHNHAPHDGTQLNLNAFCISKRNVCGAWD